MKNFNGNDLVAEEKVSIENDRALDNLSQRMMNPKLMALRAQNPFLQILPFPNQSTSVQLTANVAQEISVPSGAKFCLMDADTTFFISRNGNVAVPTAAQNSESGVMVNPRDVYWYVEEIQSFSVISETKSNFSASFFAQL